MNRAIEFCSHTGNLSLVRRFVRQFLVRQGCGESLIELMVLGIDEACTNIIRYAYGNAVDQLITLKLERKAARCAAGCGITAARWTPANSTAGRWKWCGPAGWGCT